MAALEDGKKAPDFDLSGDGGRQVRLADFRGKKVVVYFYPADDTSGCTLEAIDFSRASKEFAAADTAVIGISPDSEASHDRFKAKHDLTVTLAADPQKTAIAAYGTWVEKNMYGRKYMGVERATFLIDRHGRIAKQWHNVRVKGHVAAVLEAAEAL
jgi:peroxiredoxin Q/BCP